jgi:hypothetical protein
MKMNVLSCILSGNVKKMITDKTSISVDHEAKIWDVLMKKIRTLATAITSLGMLEFQHFHQQLLGSQNKENVSMNKILNSRQITALECILYLCDRQYVAIDSILWIRVACL